MDESTQPLLRHSRPGADGSGDSSNAKPANRDYASVDSAGPYRHYSPLPYGDIDAEISGDESEASQRQETKVYKKRWYILVVYSLLAGTQGGVWNTFGPISATSKDAFGWDNATIALLSNWGPIAYLIAGLFFSWLLDVKGLRISCLLTAALVAVGTAVRCITMEPPAVTWFMHLGQLMVGSAGPVAMAGPPTVSATWFAPHERTTSTAISAMIALIGTGAGFILGPWIVPDVPKNSTGNSSLCLRSENAELTDNFLSFSDELCTYLGKSREQRIADERKAIHLYMYIEAGWSIALFLVILIYFPKKPPLPPCPSASIQREGFLDGLKHLMRRKQFWLVAAVYGISLGVLNCWSSVLDVILEPHHIGQKEAGWIGFYAVCSSCIVSLIVARFADTFSRVMKWLVLSFYAVGTATFLVFALATVDIIPTSTGLFYATIIIGLSSLNAAVPLIFELSCELSYPIGEGTTNGVLTIVNNFAGLIFLFIMMIPDIGSAWTNWTIVGAAGICLPLLLLMKEQYNRLAIDEHNPSLRAEIIVPPPSAQTDFHSEESVASIQA